MAPRLERASFGPRSLHVMPGQKREARLFALDVPGIHVFLLGAKEDVDGRDKLGRDGLDTFVLSLIAL